MDRMGPQAPDHYRRPVVAFPPACSPARLQDSTWLAVTERDKFHLVRKKRGRRRTFLSSSNAGGGTVPPLPHSSVPPASPPTDTRTHAHVRIQTTECFQMFVERAWACAGRGGGVDERCNPPPPSAPLYPEITGCVAALGDCVVLQQTCSGIFCHQLLSFRNTNCVVGHERNGDTFKMPSKVVFVFL